MRKSGLLHRSLVCTFDTSWIKSCCFSLNATEQAQLYTPHPFLSAAVLFVVLKASDVGSVPILVPLQHLSLFPTWSCNLQPNLASSDWSDLWCHLSFCWQLDNFHSHSKSCRVGCLLVSCFDLLLSALRYCPGSAISVALDVELLSSLAHRC